MQLPLFTFSSKSTNLRSDRLWLDIRSRQLVSGSALTTWWLSSEAWTQRLANPSSHTVVITKWGSVIFSPLHKEVLRSGLINTVFPVVLWFPSHFYTGVGLSVLCPGVMFSYEAFAGGCFYCPRALSLFPCNCLEHVIKVSSFQR